MIKKYYKKHEAAAGNRQQFFLPKKHEITRYFASKLSTTEAINHSFHLILHPIALVVVTFRGLQASGTLAVF
ncbi:MAG: hypothetical protein PWQ06_1297 [Anaerophaga sp.]|nr:hypothetical protein [Anaerophaga sp.]